MPGDASGGYSPAMFASSFNPVQPMALTLVTDHLVIQGTVMSRLRRLTDLLNDPDSTHLILLDATFIEVGSRRLVAEAAAAQVQMADVLFVHPTGPSDSGGEVHTSKQTIRACLLITPFTIEGDIHLGYESELRVALAGLSEKFIPVTNARYWSYTVAESPNFVELLVVNHSRAHIAVDAGVEWKTEMPPSAPSTSSAPGFGAGFGSRDRSSNPW
jgi:hypothetical protein